MKRELIYLIVILALVLIGGFLWMELQEVKASDERKDSVIAEKNAQITYRENEKGQIIAEKNAAVLRADEIEKAYPKIAETIQKDFDIKLKKVMVYMESEFAAIGSGTGTITNNHYFDSTSRRQVRFRDFKMDDGFLKFETKLFDSLTTAQYSYSYNDTIKTVFHSNKKWYHLFKNETYSASTKLSNPNAKVTGTTNILVDTYKDKRFSVGPAVLYDPFNNRFSVGFGVSYSFIKF